MTPERLAEIREILGGPTGPEFRGNHPVEDAADDLLAALDSLLAERFTLARRAYDYGHTDGSAGYAHATDEELHAWLVTTPREPSTT